MPLDGFSKIFEADYSIHDIKLLFSRALFLNKYYANKKVPLSTEVLPHQSILGAGNTRVDAARVLRGTPIALAPHSNLDLSRPKMGLPESP
jgi:hypothetical protein